jgi:hypothetical protein
MVNTIPGYYALYPRGQGASTGAMPKGYTMVSRWIDANEAKLWMANGATFVPPHVGAGGRLYVTDFGASQPSGTGPIRIDLGVPQAALHAAGRADWKQVFQPIANVPIYNVSIHVPPSIQAWQITGKK